MSWMDVPDVRKEVRHGIDVRVDAGRAGGAGETMMVSMEEVIPTVHDEGLKEVEMVSISAVEQE